MINIKKSNGFENASKILISHSDTKYTANNSFTISCVKSRKINDDNSASNWGDLNFRFEFKNNNIPFGNISGYKSLILNRNEFFGWLISIQEAIRDDNCYDNNITVKQRYNDTDFFVRFAISQKYNCSAALFGVVGSKSGTIYNGIDSELFNQYLIQLGKMAVDILNFEMMFDQAILMYLNNQLLTYQISSQQQYFSNMALINLNKKDSENCEEETIHDIDIESIETEKEENKENEKLIENNVNEFLEDIDKELEESDLEPIFEKRLNEIENPPVEETTSREKTNLEKLIEQDNIDISFFSKLFSESQQNKCLFKSGLTNYMKQIGYNLDIDNEVSKEDQKSIQYLNQLQYFKNIISLNKNKTLDSSVYLHSKYDLKKEKSFEEIKDIYDITAIYIYISSMVEKLELRNENDIENKKFFKEMYRLVFEPYYLSYFTMNDKIPDNFEDVIINHYHQLNNGFFQPFDKLIDDNALEKISIKDLRKQIIDLKEIIIDHRKKQKSLHESYLNNNYIKLSYKNNFDEEHINDICQLESILGNDKKYEKTFIEDVIKNKKITNKNIVKFIYKNYLKDENPNKVKKDVLEKDLLDITQSIEKQNTSIYRYLEKNIDPEKCEYASKLLNFIKECGEQNIDLVKLNDVYRVHNIDEKILVAIHVWNNFVKKPKYSKYLHFIKNTIIDKKDILTLFNEANENQVEISESNENWAEFC